MKNEPSIQELQQKIKELETEISAVKNIDKELIIQKKYLEELFESTPLAIVILDNDDRISRVNREFTRLFGYEKVEAMGKLIDDLIVTPDLREEAVAITRQVNRGKDFKKESIRISKTGKKIAVQILGIPIRLDGVQLGHYGLYLDMRERNKAIEATIRSENFFREVIENAAGVPFRLIFGPTMGEGHYEYVGAGIKNLMGVSPDQFTEKYFNQMVAETIPLVPEITNDAAVNRRAFINGEIPHFKVDIRILTQDKKIKWINDSSVPLRDPKTGEVIGSYGILVDITQRKQGEIDLKKSEEQLFQAQKLEGIGQLAGGIAHDINNILTAIIGNTELAIKGTETGKNIQGHLEQVMASGKKASDLITKILAFSRKQIYYPEIIDVNTSIQGLTETLKRVISEDIKLEMKLKKRIPPIKADPTQIDQIMINVVVNAQDAIIQKSKRIAGETIIIETDEVFLDKKFKFAHAECRVGKYILISVTDTGIGIEREIIDRIFEPFFTTKESGRGTGLGLSTVYGIIKQNHGFIYVYSEPPNGTTLKIYWPAIDKKPVQIEKQLDKVSEEDQTMEGHETILFVEDDEKVREVSKKILDSFGYKVILAVNGRDALRLVKQRDLKIDMLVTDVVMPEMGGIELSEKLKVLYPELKVLYCSGYPDNRIISPFGILEKNVNFLSKPFHGNILARTIRKILDKK